MLILARHGEAMSNVESVASGIPPGEGLSSVGRSQARALRERLAGERIDLGVATEHLRTLETLQAALAGREVPTIVVSDFDEIRYGAFEGGSLDRYRGWAWSSTATAECPGGGESRAAAAARFVRALDALLARPEDTILAIGHALPIRYTIDAATGKTPASQIEPVVFADPFWLARDAVRTAAETLRGWTAQPVFCDTPIE